MRYLIVVTICFCSLTLIFSTVCNAAIEPESIVGIWLLDEGQGKEIKDTSINGNDGKIIGAEWTDGKIGKGLEFNGANRAEIPGSESIDDYRDGFTYLLWVKPTANPPNQHTRVIERDWHNPTIMIGPNDFYTSIAANADQAQTNIRGGAWEMDEWSFVAITYDGNILKLFVDGEFVGEKAVGKPDEKLGSEIRLGSWRKPGWDFTGVLDEVAVFNEPLSDDDLNHIMVNGLEEALSVTPKEKITTTWASIKGIR